MIKANLWTILKKKLLWIATVLFKRTNRMQKDWKISKLIFLEMLKIELRNKFWFLLILNLLLFFNDNKLEYSEC